MFKPMLAKDADLDQLRFPLLASAKLDGIRAIVINGVVMSRSLKPIPNKFVQSQFGHLEHFDGELIVGDPTSKTVYRDTVSHVMSHDKTDFPVEFFAFDHIADPVDSFHTRFNRLKTRVKELCHPNLLTLCQRPAESLEHLLQIEAETLELGFEGLILRDPAAPYKFGRSTAKQGYLLKLKRFIDAEAVVVGFEERMHNANEAVINELGHTSRSSHKANLEPMGDLGALVVRFDNDTHFPPSVTFSLGTGYSAAERIEIWNNREAWMGKLVKFKFFPIGMKDKPRHPVYLGERDPRDM